MKVTTIRPVSIHVTGSETTGKYYGWITVRKGHHSKTTRCCDEIHTRHRAAYDCAKYNNYPELGGSE